MLIRKKSGEVIDVDTEEVMDAADFAALIGREDDPVVQALVAEIRRLGTVLAAQQAPVVNVTPQVSAPSVNVSPTAVVESPREWMFVVKRHMGGPFHGQIESGTFRAPL